MSAPTSTRASVRCGLAVLSLAVTAGALTGCGGGSSTSPSTTTASAARPAPALSDVTMPARIGPWRAMPASVSAELRQHYAATAGSDVRVRGGEYSRGEASMSVVVYLPETGSDKLDELADDPAQMLKGFLASSVSSARPTHSGTPGLATSCGTGTGGTRVCGFADHQLFGMIQAAPTYSAAQLTRWATDAQARM